MEDNIKTSLFSDKMAIVKGTVATSNDLVIAGKFSGSIASVASVNIMAGAEVEADIVADNVTIVGKFKGQIVANDLVNICKGSVIDGKVFYGRLSVEDGSVICASTTAISKEQFKKFSGSNKIYNSLRKEAASKPISATASTGK